MHKPPAVTPPNTIQPHYDKFTTDAKSFEIELIRILSTQSSSKLTESQRTSVKRLKAKVFIFLLEIIGAEELTRSAIQTPGVVPTIISEDLGNSYLFQILMHYGFIFHANNCFAYILGEGGLEEWTSINNLLTNSYHVLFPLIHATTKSELYIGNLIITMLKEMISQKLFISEKDELIRLTTSYLFFGDFIKKIKCVPLRIQCEIYLFLLEHEEHVYNKFQAFNFESRPKDSHEKTILTLLAEPEKPTIDDDWYRYFAYATKLFRYLSSLDRKITCFQEHPLEVFKINCTIDVKNFTAIYNELSRLFSSFNWTESFRKIEDALKNSKTLQFEYSKILQTKYLLQSLLEVLERSLTLSVSMINYALTNTKGHNWQIYYNLLQLKKMVLDNRLRVNELSQTITGEAKSIDESTLASINGIICTLRAMDLEAASSKEKFDAIKSTKQEKKRKKFVRNRRKANDDSHKNSEETRLSKVTAKVEGLITDKQYDQACTLYHDFLQLKDLSTQERILALSSLAEIYQGMAEKNKALENYTEALRLTEEALGTEQEVEQRKFFEAQANLLRDIIKEFEKNPSDKETSSDEETSTDECADSVTIPNPTVISTDIPLPEFFHHINRLLSPHNIALIVVGGTVRDSLQEKRAKDLDAVIFDRTLQVIGNGLIYKILDLIRSHYPTAEVRGRRHPVLYIQHQEMIVEISCLKVSNTPSNQTFAKENNPKLLFSDASSRDTTDCALYYDPEKKVIIDFFNGVSDIRENRLVTISPPNVTFSKEPELIFRVLRSIVRRSIGHPNLVYSADIITAMRQHIERLSDVNKDRCFREITNMFFCGNGCATWQFLSRYGLAKYFLILPTGEDLNFKHSAMIQRALSSLDSRIKHGKSFHHSFTFAVLLWGAFCEKLETKLTESNVRQTAESVCKDNRLIFRLPEKLAEEIKQIWFTYLHNTKKLTFNHPQFKQYHYVLASLLENFIKRSMHVHHKPITELRNGFFHRSRLEFIIKDIICSNNIVYSYSNKVTTLTLGKTKALNAESTPILKKLKHFLINMFGDEEVEIEHDQNALYLSTDYFDKKNAIDRLMEFVFDHGNEEVTESKLQLIL